MRPTLLLLTLVVVAVLHGVCAFVADEPADPSGDGYGMVEVALEFQDVCPSGYRSLCDAAPQPLAWYARLNTGEPRAQRRLCVGVGEDMADRVGVAVFAPLAGQSSRYDPVAHSDLLDLGPIRIRYPMAPSSGAGAVSPICDGVLPLGPAAALWRLWPNLTLSSASLVLGGVPRLGGVPVPFDSPVLDCEPLGGGLCATRGSVFNTTYRVVFGAAGRRQTRVPPALYSQLQLHRTFDGTPVEVLFPPVPLPPPPSLAAAECARRYHDDLGVRAAGGRGACGDGSGVFRLQLTAGELEYHAPSGVRMSLLESQSEAEAEALRLRHGGVDTVELSSDVWRRLRMHVSRRQSACVLAEHHQRQHVSAGNLVAALFMAVLLLRHEVTNTHLAWAGRRLTPAIAKTVVAEAVSIGLVGYTVLSPDARRVVNDAPTWFYPSLITTVALLCSVVLVALALFVWNTLRRPGILANFVVFGSGVEVGDTVSSGEQPGETEVWETFHRNERLHLVRSVSVETALLWGLYMLSLERFVDDFGQAAAVVAVAAIQVKTAMALLRVITIDADAAAVGMAIDGPLRWPRRLGWLLFVVALLGVYLYAGVVGGIMTVVPWLRRTQHFDDEFCVAGTAFFVMLSASAAAFFNQLFALQLYEDQEAVVQQLVKARDAQTEAASVASPATMGASVNALFDAGARYVTSARRHRAK